PELSEPSFTGFWTEVLGNKAPYNQRINNRTYRVIERKYAVFPTQTGKLTIGRATIRATVATRGGMSRDPFDALFGNVIGRGQEIAVHSQPVTVNVRPLPEAGKPKHFTGTIGRYSISAVANKRTVDVNQPVSVSIKITGVGNIKSVAEPLIPDLDDFRVYRESSDEKMSKVNDKLGGTKTFEEVFIPKRPGKLTIPALEFNFFDPSTGKYRVLHTRPITLKVTKPEGYAASPDVPYTRPELSVSPNTQELRYIKTKLDDLHPVGALLIASPTYIIINALPVLMLAGMIAVRVRRERLAGDVAYARSRQASRLARKRLSKARSLAKTETAEQFFAEISLALTAFVADKLNMSPYGLTSDRLQELLRERGADEALVADLKTLLQQADFARFAPATVTEQTIETALHDAEQLMVRMEGLRFA
ncbi:MAG: protein BatD, partial [Candidatus Zixiibacteriota bacterium]